VTVVKDRFAHKVGFEFAFVGTGQGGSRIANAFHDLGYGRVAVFNTTDMDFKGLAPEIPKLNLGVGGAAKDAAFAADQIRDRQEEVWDLLTRAWGSSLDYGLVCASLGGGTGSGTAPWLVKIARKYMEQLGRPPKVGAIVALPAAGEGQQQCKNAVTAFRELLALKVSPLVVIDNARINELYKPSVAKLYPTANTTAANLFHVFNQLAAVHSDYITFDQSELGQLLDGGVVTMGAADFDVDSIKSPADVSTKIRDELAGNVLAAVDLRTGKTAACVFVGHKSVLDSLPSDYFDAGFNQLDRQVGSALAGVSPVVHRGLYDSEAAESDPPSLQVYTMVSGLTPPLDRLAQLAKVGHMPAEVRSPAGVAAFLGVQD
jgi:cell division GTPase FtsZ